MAVNFDISTNNYLLHEMPCTLAAKAEFYLIFEKNNCCYNFLPKISWERRSPFHTLCRALLRDMIAPYFRRYFRCYVLTFIESEQFFKAPSPRSESVTFQYNHLKVTMKFKFWVMIKLKCRNNTTRAFIFLQGEKGYRGPPGQRGLNGEKVRMFAFVR